MQPTGDRPRPRITVDVGTLELHGEATGDVAMVATLPPDFLRVIIERYKCRVEQMGQIAELRSGYQRILVVLVSAGILLILGLMVYGLKMTHRVAGPLHKVTLYFEKMKRGVYDEVYNLRKGDQLMEFYDHFKAAHGGLRAMQAEDIEQLRAVLDAAETDDLASRSPELAAAIADLEGILEHKEKSLD